MQGDTTDPGIAPPFATGDVAARFAGFPDAARGGLLALRRLIFDTAAGLPEVGRIEETLKWGQPAYLTPDTRSGTTIRLGVPNSGGFGMYVHCQTTLIEEFRQTCPGEFHFDGNRAVLFADGDMPPDNRMRLLIARALRYRVRG